MIKPRDTYHAPAVRTSIVELQPLIERLQGDYVIQTLLNGYPEIALLLDQNRQIISCNQAFLKLLRVTDLKQVIGQRLGEVLQCVHASEMSAGCGTSEACQTCDAVNSILKCKVSNCPARGMCRIATDALDLLQAWDLEVVVTPLETDGLRLMIFAARDIAAVKRREALERLFFHDVLNVAGGIHGLAELLQDGEAYDPQTHPERLRTMSRQLIEHISAQRDLAAAEEGDLIALWSTVSVSELFHDLKAAYESHPVARERSIVFGTVNVPVLQSDRILLRRVLGNLIKNALEASDPGGKVTIACERVDDVRIRFSVHNETVIPHRIQLQIFKRSFSTKTGKGRGLGTFSVKLLTTQSLKGSVEFHSDEGSGTTFTVTLPLRQTADWNPGVAYFADGQQDWDLKGHRVLVAEDGLDNQRLIAHVLQKAGAEVTLAEHGQSAVDSALAANAAGAPYDVILMDMQMPVMDGYVATAQLRARGYTQPIVALTAHAMMSEWQKCLDAGCNDYASKPINRQALLQLIQQHAAISH